MGSGQLRLVIDNLRLQYQGMLDFNEMYKIMDYWFREKGYDKYEIRNYEIHTPEGKQVEIELHPWKKMTTSEEIQFKIKIFARHLKDFVVPLNGKKVKKQEGEVIIDFTAYIRLDYEDKWRRKSYFVFLRAIFDQFLYKQMIDRYTAYIEDEINHLYRTVKNYLNMNKF